MRRATVLAAAGAALLLAATPGLAGTLGEAASRALAPTGAHVKCSDADVAGCQQWIRRFRGDEADIHRLHEVDLAADGSVLLAAGTWQPTYEADPDAAVRAMDPATGDVLWSFTWDTPDHGNNNVGKVFVSPDGSTVYVVGATDEDTAVHALEAETGTRRWTRILEGLDGFEAAYAPQAGWIGVLGMASRAPDGDYKPHVAGLSVDDPSTTWERFLALHNASATLGLGTGLDAAGGRLVAVSATAPAWDRVDVLDPATGQVETTVPMHRPDASGYLDVDVGPDGDLAAVPLAQEENQRTTLVDLADGERLWTASVPETPDPSGYTVGFPEPAVAWSPDGDRVAFAGSRSVTHDVGHTRYANTNHGGLVVRQAATGAVVWDRYGDDDGDFRAVAWTGDGTVVAAGDVPSGYAGGPGGVVAFEADDGTRKWAHQQPDTAYEGTYRALAADASRVYAGGWAETANYWDPWEVVGVDRAADVDTTSPTSP